MPSGRVFMQYFQAQVLSVCIEEYLKQSPILQPPAININWFNLRDIAGIQRRLQQTTCFLSIRDIVTGRYSVNLHHLAEGALVLSTQKTKKNTKNTLHITNSQLAHKRSIEVPAPGEVFEVMLVALARILCN